MHHLTPLIASSDLQGALEKLGAAIIEALQQAGLKLIFWLLKMALCIVVFIVLRKILRKIVAFIDKRLEKRNVVHSVRSIILWCVQNIITIYAVVQMLLMLDLLQSASIAAAVAAIGVGVSMALQGAIGNFAGGLLLIFLKPFKEGDYIQVDNSIEGTVKVIHVYYTTLVTVYNDVIKVPNSKLTNLSVRSMVGDGAKGVEIHVGVSYDQNLEKPLELLKKVMDEDERIFKEPRVVFVHELGDNAVIVGLRCRCKREDFLQVQWGLNKRIRQTFDAEDVSIPYPQLDVHINPEISGKSRA